jgi:hypothetical protein
MLLMLIIYCYVIPQAVSLIHNLRLRVSNFDATVMCGRQVATLCLLVSTLLGLALWGASFWFDSLANGLQ